MDRRTFIRKSCFSCGMLAGTGTLMTMLESCNSLSFIQAEPENDRIVIPESAFLQDETMKIVRSASLKYDVLLLKEPEGRYKALFLKCTHIGNPLLPDKKGVSCNLHGSRFDLDGKVTQGPALRDLVRFKVETEQQNIVIFINENRN